MEVLIIGAGAIGGTLAAWMSEIAQVTLLERNEETAKAISENGLTVKDGRDILKASCRTVTSIGKEEKFDYCFTATRAYNLKEAVTDVLDNLKSDSIVVSMNNGICLNALAEVVGSDRAAACSINYGVGISSPGNYYIKIHGDLVIGMEKTTRPLLTLAENINRVVPCRVTDNIIGELYSKMLINSCITSTAVLSGLTLGEILSRKEGRKVFDGIIKEGMDVANAYGITVPKYKRKLNYYTLYRNNLFGKIAKRIQYAYLGHKYGKRVSATLEALKRGVKTETEFYNGYIVKLAGGKNIDTPVNRAVCDMIAEIEKDLSKISPDNLKKAVCFGKTSEAQKKHQ